MIEKPMKYKIFLVIVLLFTAFPAGAAVFQTGNEYTLPERESLVEDLYVSGEIVSVGGVVEGDVISGSAKMLINGAISDDVIAMAGTIDILGPVGDDVRIMAGQVGVNDAIAGDVIALVGQIQMLPETAIGGDVVIAGGRIVLDGTIAGDVRVYGGEVVLNGVVGGNLEVFADDAFHVGDDARVGGSLTYRAPKEVLLSAGAVAGEVAFERHAIRFDKAFFEAVLGAAFLLKVLMLLVAGLLAVVFFRAFSYTVSDFAVSHFGKNVLVGFVLLIVVPALSILLLISVIGVFVGLIFMLLYALALAIAHVYAGIVTGALLSRWFRKEVVVDWRWAFMGIVVIQLVGLIPVIGWVFSGVMVLAAWGALACLAHEKFWVAR